MKILKSIPGIALLLWNSVVSTDTAAAMSWTSSSLTPKPPVKEMLLLGDDVFHRRHEDSDFTRLPAITEVDWDQLALDHDALMAVERSV